jgi:hypothetical protein
MKTSKKKAGRMTRRAGVVAAVGFVAASATLVGGGCDTISNPLDAVCCTDFKPGTNMLDVDWGLEGQANADFGVTIQAIGDFSAAASAMVTDLGTSCRGMAVELGVDPKAVDTADPGDYTTQWCAKAVEEISKISAQITVSVQPAECRFSAEVQASCEGHCQVDASCDPGSIEARCDPGELVVKCDAACTGSCEGSANVAVSCEGACDGSCEGTCSGTQDGGICNGTCSGKCRGSCQADGSANVACEGECSGSCSGTATAPRCKAELKPPSCEASADCQASCKASASAQAECTPPSVEIVGAANLDAKIAVLKKYLPQIYAIAEARAKILAQNAQAMIDVSGNLEGALDAESTAAFCLVPAGVAIVDAGDNLAVSVSASVDVITSVEGG